MRPHPGRITTGTAAAALFLPPMEHLGIAGQLPVVLQRSKPRVVLLSGRHGGALLVRCIPKAYVAVRRRV